MLHASRGRVGAEQIEEDGAGTEVVDVDKKTDGSRGGRGRGDALGESDAPREVPAVSVAPVSTVRSAGRGDADVPGISMAAVLA